MDESIQRKISELIDKCVFDKDGNGNGNAADRCDEVLSLISTSFPDIQFLKINNTVLFENVRVEHVDNDNFLEENQQNIINDIKSMAPVECILKFCLKDSDNVEAIDNACIVLKIVLTEEFPLQKPFLSILSTENLCVEKINQFQEFLDCYFETNGHSYGLFDFLYDCTRIVRNLNKSKSDVSKTISGDMAMCKISNSGRFYQRRITSDEPKSIFNDRRSSLDKMIRVVIGEDEDSDFCLPINIMQKYSFISNQSFAVYELKLFEPSFKQFYHKYGPIVFSSNVIEYKAFNLSHQNSSEIQFFRVTVYEFELSPFRDKFRDVYDAVEPIILVKLRLMNNFQPIKKEKLSQYIHIESAPINDHCFRLIAVKESFPTNQNGINYYPFEEFIQISSIGKKQSNNRMITNYLINMFDLLSTIHKDDLFHGDFDVKKIFLTNNEEVLLYDSYYDTFMANLIPSVIKETVNVTDPKTIKYNGKQYLDFTQLIAEMMSNDIFNFGLFMYFLFSDVSNSTPNFDLFRSEYRNQEDMRTIFKGINLIQNPDLRQLIRSCLVLDEECRPKRMEAIAGYRDGLLKAKTSVATSEDDIENLEFLDTVDEKYFPRLQREFRIISILGQGGFGTVIKAHRPIDGKSALYAIKLCILKRHRLQASILETRFLSQLNHQNVVRYYSCWFENKKNVDDFIEGPSSYVESIESSPSSESNDIVTIDSQNHLNFDMNVLCIQMELCESTTLATYVTNKKSSELPKPKEKIFCDIVSGLAYIHEHTIIHRDLKPQNILFGLNGNEIVAKIGDFGLSCLCDTSDFDQNTMVTKKKQSYDMGSLYYTAPETHKKTFFNAKCAIRGFISDQPYTTKVDIYSLGIIYFELCYPVYTGSERVEVLTAIRQKQPEFPSDFNDRSSQKDRQLISKLLSFDPEHRPTAMELKYFFVDNPGEVQIDEGTMKKITSVPILLKLMVKNIFEEKSSLSKSFIDSRYDSLKHDLQIGVTHLKENYYYKIWKINLARSYARVVAGFYSAADTPFPSLIPKIQLEGRNEHLKMGTRFNRYLCDENGIVVTLPYHVRAHLANYVAKATQHCLFLRRSSTDKCFIQIMDPYSTQELHEITFDLIWPKDWSDEANQILPFCEILGFAYHLLVYFVLFSNANTIDSSISSADSLENPSTTSGTQILFFITNMTILRAVLDFLHLSTTETMKIIHLLAENDVQLLKQDYFKFRRDFQVVLQQVSESKMQCIFDLIKIIDSDADCFLESISKALMKVSKKNLVNKFIKKISPFCDEMVQIVNLTRATYFEFCPKTTKNSDEDLVEFVYSFSFISKDSFFYNHLLINVGIKKYGQEPIIIGYGGRYDNLIRNFAKKEHKPSTASKKDGPHIFSASRNGIGISFDLNDLCNLIPNNTRLNQIEDFNMDFINSCRKYMDNQIEAIFPIAKSSNGMAALDIMICSSVVDNANIRQLMPVCSLANELRKNGLRVAVLPEVAHKDLIKIKSDKISTSRLNWCLQQNMQWFIAIETCSPYACYCFQRVENFSNTCDNNNNNDWKANWILKEFDEYEKMYNYLFEKLSIVMKRDNFVEKRICSPGSRSSSVVDHRFSDTTQCDYSKYNIEIWDELCSPMKIQDRIRYQEGLQNELKRMTFLNLANMDGNLKIMAINIPTSVIRAIADSIQLSKLQQICPVMSQRNNQKIKRLVHSFVENIVSKNRDMSEYRAQIEKCLTESCNFFADKFLESTNKHAALILFPLSSIDQYRIIIA